MARQTDNKFNRQMNKQINKQTDRSRGFHYMDEVK